MKKVILNHKSYLMYDEIVKYKSELNKIKSYNYDFILFPNILYLTCFKNSKYGVGTQDFYSTNPGSYPGELNLKSLSDIGVNYTMLGTHDRTILLNETIDDTREKLFKSLNFRMNTILCVGESKKTATPFLFIKKQINNYLKNIEKKNLKYLSLVYEPYTSIGTRQISTSEIKNIVKRIKIYMKNMYKVNVEVYYGGLITRDNVGEIFEVTDGIVLGKQSTNINELNKILSIIA